MRGALRQGETFLSQYPATNKTQEKTTFEPHIMKKLRFAEDPRPRPSCGAELGVVPFIQNFSINID
jgi:hypothetical protein